MFHSQRGSAMAWVIVAIIVLAAAGTILYFTVFRDSGGEEKGTDRKDTAGQATEDTGDTPPQSDNAGGGNLSPGGSGTVEEHAPADPGSNVRDTTVTLSPPIDSAEEAFAAVLETPEALDWYWAVEDPRYATADEGAAYTVRLYSIVLSEDGSSEREIDFGSYRVDKQTGTVSEITR